MNNLHLDPCSRLATDMTLVSTVWTGHSRLHKAHTTPQLQGSGGHNRILGSHPHHAPNLGLDSFSRG